MSLPCSPIGLTTPSTTSSTRPGSSPGLRVLTSSSSPTIRSTGFTSWREPTALPFPRGVRMWSYTSASAMTVLVSSVVPRGRGASGTLASPDCDTDTVRVKVGQGGTHHPRTTSRADEQERVVDKSAEDRVESLRELLTLDELTNRVGLSV